MFFLALMSASFSPETIFDALPADRSRVPSVAQGVYTLEQFKRADERVIRAFWKSERNLIRLQDQLRKSFESNGLNPINLNEVMNNLQQMLHPFGFPIRPGSQNPTNPKKDQ